MVESYGVLLYSIILSVSVFLYVLSAVTRNKAHPRKKKTKLPPGSMGWPYVGETLQLYSQDPNIFFTDRETRFH